MFSSKQASVVISFQTPYFTRAATNWRVKNSQETTTLEDELKTIRRWRIVSFSTYLWASARSAYCWRGYSCYTSSSFFSLTLWSAHSSRSSKGRTQARSQIALSTSGRHIEMISLPLIRQSPSNRCLAADTHLLLDPLKDLSTAAHYGREISCIFAVRWPSEAS